MSFLNKAFEARVTETADGSILLRDRFLFWEKRAVIRPAEDRIEIISKGLFFKKRKAGKIADAVIRIETEDMGGPSYQLRFGCAATLIVDDQRFVLTRQYGVEYVDSYIQRLLEKVGGDLRVDRAV